MLDGLGAAVCVADADAVLYVNGAFEALTGWSADEAIGRGPDAVLGPAPAELERTGRAIVAIPRRDGTAMRCELALSELADGSWAVVLTPRDFGSDEAVMVETVLRVERDRAQSYLDVASALLVILYADGTVGLLNRHGRELLDDAGGELIGRELVRRGDPARGARRRARRVRAAASTSGEAVEHYEAEVVTRRGRHRRIAWQATALVDAKGRMRGRALGPGHHRPRARRAGAAAARVLRRADRAAEPLAARVARAGGGDARAPARPRGRAAARRPRQLQARQRLARPRRRRPAAAPGRRAAARRRGRPRRCSPATAATSSCSCSATCRATRPRKSAREAADQLALRLAKPFTVAGAEFHVEASIGISIFPEDADSAEALLQHADAAMYQSKGRGRAASTVYAGVTHDPLERLSLSRRLRRAIARSELVLHFQPIVWTASGRLHSMEALLRWNDPDRGLVHPDRFIPAAEEMGLLDPIGAWVIDALAKQIGEWQALGLEPRVSFNVSPRQLLRPDFATELGEQLRAAGVDPSLLTMELTESATLREPERIGPLLRELRALGLQLAIDDFGAGWSSLSRLRLLPVQMLKIDRSFLRAIPEDPEAGAIVRAVIALSDALGMTTVAEGVEQPVQQHFLAAQGCPLSQGRLFGDALPVAAMTERLAGERA